MCDISKNQSQTTASILDEYCRYYSDFSKILDIYVKNIYPQFHFEIQQLLDASYNVWHRLSDADKISLATFLEELNQEGCSLSTKTTTCNSMINTNSNNTSSPKRVSITPFHLYLKDGRKKFLRRHSKMSMRDMNKCLSERWQKMSNRMKYKYEYRAYLAKKRLYKKQGKSIQLKKPSFIKRMSSRGNLFVKNK